MFFYLQCFNNKIHTLDNILERVFNKNTKHEGQFFFFFLGTKQKGHLTVILLTKMDG